MLLSFDISIKLIFFCRICVTSFFFLNNSHFRVITAFHCYSIARMPQTIFRFRFFLGYISQLFNSNLNCSRVSKSAICEKNAFCSERATDLPDEGPAIDVGNDCVWFLFNCLVRLLKRIRNGSLIASNS